VSDVSTSLGISGGSFGRKSELVADLTSAFKTLNAELTKTRDLSAQIAKNMKGAHPGGAGGGENLLGSSFGSGSGDAGGAAAPQQTGLSAAMSGGLNIIKGALTLGLGAGTAMASMLPSTADIIDAQLGTSQAGAGMGLGYGGARSMVAGMMSAGRYTNMTAASDALVSGQYYGLTAAKGGNAAATYNAIANFNPAIAGNGGAIAAVANNLNQAQNVNMSRMIGINIRGTNGQMRPLPEIVNDLWKYLESGKRTKGPITVFDLDNSLQPGMALDSILNTYFSGSDANTRTTIVNMLYAKARGKILTSSGAQATGISTSAIASQAYKEASKYNSGTGAAGADILTGYEKANNVISKINDKFNAWGNNPAIKLFLEGKGFLDQLGANGGSSAINLLTGGAALLSTGLIAKGVGKIGKAAFKGVKNLFNWGKKEAKTVVKDAETVGKDAEKLAIENSGKIIEGTELVADEAAGAVLAPVTGGASEVVAQVAAAAIIAQTAWQVGSWAYHHRKTLKKVGSWFVDSVTGQAVDKSGNFVDPKTGKPLASTTTKPTVKPAAATPTTPHEAAAAASHPDTPTPHAAAHAAVAAAAIHQSQPKPAAAKATTSSTTDSKGNVVNNYGGVTINVNGTGSVDPVKLANQIKAMLQADAIRANAMKP
jgi:hypothetical protein